MRASRPPKSGMAARHGLTPSWCHQSELLFQLHLACMPGARPLSRLGGASDCWSACSEAPASSVCLAPAPAWLRAHAAPPCASALAELARRKQQTFSTPGMTPWRPRPRWARRGSQSPHSWALEHRPTWASRVHPAAASATAVLPCTVLRAPAPAVQAEAMGHETLQHHKERVHMTGATGKRGPGPCPARPTCRAAFASCLASRLLPAFEGTPC